MAVNDSATFAPLISRERIGNAIGQALALYVGRRGRRYEFKQLSNATGVKVRVIECAMHPADSIDYRPLPLDALASISAFLGSDFTNEWLHLTGQGAFELPDDEAPPPGELAADIASDSAEVVRLAADGKFCGEDRKTLRSVGQRKVARGKAMMAMVERRSAA